MPKSHLVKFDAVSRKTLKMHEPGHTGEIIFEQTTDISPHLELNKEMRKDLDGTRFADGQDLFARIPPEVYWNLPEHIRNDEKEFKKWLMHDDQEPFRLRNARI